LYLEVELGQKGSPLTLATRSMLHVMCGSPSVNCINAASLCQGANCEESKKQERHATKIARNSYDNA